jgi:hypothetical protein
MKNFPGVTPRTVLMGGGVKVTKYEARFKKDKGYIRLGIHPTPEQAQAVVDEYARTGKKPPKRNPMEGKRKLEYIDGIRVVRLKRCVRYEVRKGSIYMGRFETIEQARRAA